MPSTKMKRSALFFTIFFALAIGVAPIAAAEVDDIELGRTWVDQFSPSMKSQMSKPVPMVLQEWPLLLGANLALLERSGVTVPRNHRFDPAWEAKWLKKVAVRPAHFGEPPLFDAQATRYWSQYGIRGDGRAARIFDLVERDPVSGKTRAVEADVKGFGTGLKPDGWGGSHSSGKERLEDVFADNFFADYLNGNSVAANSYLSMVRIDNGDGLTVRGGDMPRVAHLHQAQIGLPQHEAAEKLRELFDRISDRLVLEQGGRRRHTMPQLFRAIVERKAKEVAQLFALRIAHGAPTVDNTFLLEFGDNGTNTVLDRGHWKHIWEDAPQMGGRGFGEQADTFLFNFIAKDVYGLMRDRTALSPAEWKTLSQMNPAAVVGKALNRHMTMQLLLNAGFAERDAWALISRHSDKTRAFHDLVIRLSQQLNSGATHRMVGPKGADTVKEPARYNVHAALATLASARLERDDHQRRVDEINHALATQATGTNGNDATAAKELVDGFEGLISALSTERTLDQGELAGMLRMMQTNAYHRGRTMPQMIRSSLRRYGEELARKASGVHDEGSLRHLRAEIETFRRSYRYLGEGTPYTVAQQLAANQPLPKQRNGMTLLAETKENGVAIRQLSDGRRDTIEVELVGNPLGLRNLSQYRMHYDTRGAETGWSDVKPRVNGDALVFEIDVTGKPKAELKRFVAAFFAPGESGTRWENNFGFNWGTHMPVLFADRNVDAALGLLAKRNGKERVLTAETRQVRDVMRHSFKPRRRALKVRPAMNAVEARAWRALPARGRSH